ncbi:hypothetical protein IHE45_20G057700 [Dioscorea alata]|uniref:Uncharacterized protein n=1 Tax=Dioscorea alata TaxID=55571 RepID=A0ACB7TS39_DIOAL|nr:hypothetical protein IHE45_20G057700 [Dioscorea alata]
MILESLDSLWFFSNILSASSSPIPCTNAITIKLQTSNSQPHHPVNTLKTTKLETDVDVQVLPLKPEKPKKLRATKEKEKQKLKHQKNDIEDGLVEELVFLGLSLQQLSVKQRMKTGMAFHCCSMPPLNDGLAMKKHLKSWAHAVACTVR